MTSPKNGTIWKVATGALGLFIVTTGAMYSMVQAHAGSPHRDSLARPEFEIFKDTVQGRLGRIEAKLDRLLEKR